MRVEVTVTTLGTFSRCRCPRGTLSLSLSLSLYSLGTLLLLVHKSLLTAIQTESNRLSLTLCFLCRLSHGTNRELRETVFAE